jgi:hypothetical protein
MAGIKNKKSFKISKLKKRSYFKFKNLSKKNFRQSEFFK